jgi:hypothetical protein
MRENILIAFYCAEYNRVTNPATLKTDADIGTTTQPRE